MSRVRFYELKRTKKLIEMEQRINAALKSRVKSAVMVRLFQTSDGQIGYSMQVVPSSDGREMLDEVHRAVCQIIGYKRGRPPGTPTHQVKCRIPEEAYRELVREAHRRHLPPSRLAGELITQQIGA